ncbi:EamA family transporter [uncultured Cohaesibacter sp.]|uniref:EamA family transporter n=1 Tax=uncultured Cohaesibacter sp. TaxID=1002546 RepID=UPI0029C9A3EE|nr:EamA family transporter [uncultured Cohaesibacter sp.]
MRLIHILLALLVAAIWGFNFVVIRVGIDAMPPLMFSALRFLFAAIPLVFFVPRPQVPWPLLLAIGFILGVVKFGLLFVGMHVGLSAGLASLVLQSQAFFTVILASVILGERPRSMQIIGILVAFCGVALVALTVDADVTITGLLLVISAAFAWSLSNLLMKKAAGANMLHLMIWISLIPPLPLLALSALFEGGGNDLTALLQLDWKAIGAVAYIAYGATIIGFAIWGRLIAIYGAGRIAPFSLLVPIFGMGSSALFLGEEFGSLRLLAALLVIFGLVLTVLRFPHKKVQQRGQS